MIESAQEILDDLAHCSSLPVDAFNKSLLDLFSTIPRSMGTVSHYLASSVCDYQEIIDREQKLLDIMRGQVITATTAIPVSSNEPVSDKTILEAFGLSMEEATPNEVEKIKKLMRSQVGKFRRAWRVTNNETQERFDKFVKDEQIAHTKLLWHGSRTENFWSIMRTGLKLRPTNAILTGSMFGHGCYFANSCSKSIGYTSLHGSRWAGGSSQRAFMCLFDVAYGTPYDVYQFDSKYYDLDYNKLQKFKKGAHCLHAHADKGMLHKDEIVVYKEAQMTIRYLIEIGD